MSRELAGRTCRRSVRAGFTLIELLMVLAIGVILAAIAVPNLRTNDRTRVQLAAREIQQELHAARLRAVGANRRLEVRLNCPAPGQYRIVEAGWPETGRCNPAVYPFPAPADAAYRTPPMPRFDGPVRFLNSRISLAGSAAVLQFAPDGRATKLQGGAPALIATETVTVSIPPYSATVEVNGMGKVRIQ